MSYRKVQVPLARRSQSNAPWKNQDTYLFDAVSPSEAHGRRTDVHFDVQLPRPRVTAPAILPTACPAWLDNREREFPSHYISRW